MQYFLQEVARDVYKKYGNALSGICLVFPNRRSGLFFKRYLTGELENPIWSPEVLTISDLMQQFSGLQKADQLSLIFMLYQVFKKEKQSQEPFDEFYHWGEMLLRDFDDIDKYLVDPRDIFRNLARLKSLEDHFSYLTEEQIESIRRFWDTLNVSRLSKEQNDFISIWQVLYNVYFHFNRVLDEQKQGYEGKIYRAVTDRINSQKLTPKHDKYIFIGFNALTPVEHRLFKELKQREKAVFYWDYDHYYLKDHEAGSFIHQNMEHFQGEDLGVYDGLKQDKHIQFVNTPYDISQAKILPDLLTDMPDKYSSSPDKTAIVLPEEHLLLPVLNSLPETPGEVNVTMGYPVYSTPAFSFLLTLIRLQENVKKQNGEVQFYYNDVLSVLNHQYLGIIRDEQVEQLIEQIHKHNKIYIPSGELTVNNLFRAVFALPESYESLSDYLLDNYYRFYTLLKQQNSGENYSLRMELESIYYVYIAIKRLKEIFKQHQANVKPATYLRILERVVKNQSIPFQGEPLSGIQVMGLLETRTLDFENLIILSMNEGVFPQAESTPSFIPFSLRKGFGLPTYEHNDAIYAYYFYRLVQRAKNITLVYNSGSDGLKTGEMSRFMHQLKFETNFDIRERTVVSGISIPEARSVTVAKTPEILDVLEKYNAISGSEKNFSPSAINTYLMCSLQFYYRYIAGLKEPEEVTENVDLPLFGSLLHKAIQLLYEPYRMDQNQISSDELKKLERNDELIEARIMEAFREEYFSDFPEDKKINLSGKNLLIKDIIYQYIKQFLKVEQKFAPFLPLALEESCQTSVNFGVDGKEKSAVIKGDIDRVDEHDAGIRIIDYKTGQPQQSYKDVPSLFEKYGNHAALQALIYSRMYSEVHGPQKKIVPGLYFFRRIYQDDFDWSVKMNKHPVSYDEVKVDLEEHLRSLLEEIFDPEETFTQTDDRNTCRFCPYAKICRRD
ncbi:MAG: PD-(D/E)XK nuclease family protein [Bacteroidales bacterium]|nr:PD-(D/E)XK nuclease family protein [Bacteroidales bacterium]